MTDETPDAVLVANVAEAIYGATWQSHLARDLDLNLRTVQRIAAAAAEGKAYRARTGVLRELAEALNGHIIVCQELFYELVDRLEGPPDAGAEGL